MKIRLSQLKRIIKEEVIRVVHGHEINEDRAYSEQIIDVHVAVEILKDFLLDSSMNELKGCMIWSDGNVLLRANLVPGFKDSLFGILQNVADPSVVDAAKGGKSINIIFLEEAGVGMSSATTNNIIGFNTSTKKVTPGRVSMECQIPGDFADSIMQSLDEGLSAAEAWDNARKNCDSSDLDRHLSLGLSHEIGHFLDLMRQGEKTFAKIGAKQDHNARFNNLTSQLLDMIAGRNPKEIRQLLGNSQLELLNRIKRWSNWNIDGTLFDLDRKMIAKISNIYDAALMGRYSAMKPNKNYDIKKVNDPQFKILY